MSKNASSLRVEEMEKSILDPDQSQILTDWALAEGLSFHKIWLKSVDNFLRHSADRQTHRHGYQITSAISLADVTIRFTYYM